MMGEWGERGMQERNSWGMTRGEWLQLFALLAFIVIGLWIYWRYLG